MADSSNAEQVARCGLAIFVPEDYTVKQTTTLSNQSKQGGQSNSNTRTISNLKVDKQTGSYARATNKEVISTGETFKERSTGRVGYKDEYKNTSTYRYGDRSGYTEYQVEERFRKVSYGGTGSSNKGKNKYIK